MDTFPQHIFTYCTERSRLSSGICAAEYGLRGLWRIIASFIEVNQVLVLF